MSAQNPSSSAIPLNYGTEEPRWKRILSAFHTWFARWWESVGYCVGMGVYLAGGARQTLLAFGCAFLAGGLGLALEPPTGSTAPFWMWIGGFLIGLIIPASKRGPGKQ